MGTQLAERLDEPQRWSNTYILEAEKMRVSMKIRSSDNYKINFKNGSI
jgi:hypothetical protein